MTDNFPGLRAAALGSSKPVPIDPARTLIHMIAVVDELERTGMLRFWIIRGHQAARRRLDDVNRRFGHVDARQAIGQAASDPHDPVYAFMLSSADRWFIRQMLKHRSSEGKR